jgi:hypothetical protein
MQFLFSCELMRQLTCHPGLVIGVLAGLAVLGAATLFVMRQTKNWRDGYTKESLNGAGGTGRAANGRAAYGGGQGRGGGSGAAAGGRRVGGGWGTRVAAREANGDAFGVMPAPPTNVSRRDSQH